MEKRFASQDSAQTLIDLAWGLTAEEGARKLRSLWLDYRSAMHIHQHIKNDWLVDYCRARVRVFLAAYRCETPAVKDMEIVK